MDTVAATTQVRPTAAASPLSKPTASAGAANVPLVPLLLSVPKRTSPRPARAAPAGTELPAARRREVLERDRQRCRFCALALPEYLEVDNRDDDHSNNKLGNLLTACAWCHGVHHLEERGRLRLGVLAIHPEWPVKELPAQWQIHHLLRAMLAAPQEAEIPVQLLGNFLYEDCVSAVGAWLPSSDPVWLGERLLELPEAEGRDRSYLSGLRLLPASDPPPQPDERTVAAWAHETAVRTYWASELTRELGEYWDKVVGDTRG
jgi:hypothetical protein